MAKGEVFKDLRMPQVAHDAESVRTIITFHGEEDLFVVLHMRGDVAEDLTQRLVKAGFGDRR
jgi:hypothetical protein